MNMIRISVMYSCVLCGLQKNVVRVPARPENMDLKKWMDQTIQFVSDDHRSRSPDCIAASLTDLLIPTDGISWVGGPPIQ